MTIDMYMEALPRARPLRSVVCKQEEVLLMFQV